MVGTKKSFQNWPIVENIQAAVQDYRGPSETKTVTGVFFFSPWPVKTKEAVLLLREQMGDLKSNSAAYSQAVLWGEWVPFLYSQSRIKIPPQ